MASLDVLNNLRVAAPCPASWAAMRGDDRLRFCEACSKNVYNLSDLTSADAVALLHKAEGRLCMHLYRRTDGTVLTGDCPAGLRFAVRRRVLRLATIGVVLAATLQSAMWFRKDENGIRGELPPVPTGPGVTFSDWAQWASMALGIKSPAPGPRFIGGDVY